MELYLAMTSNFYIGKRKYIPRTKRLQNWELPFMHHCAFKPANFIWLREKYL